MKTSEPNWLKYSLWWLFKSPQRTIDKKTLGRDIIGLIWYLIQKTPLKSKINNISICVGIYNRSETFLNHFLPTLAKCKYLEKIELSVYDCGSDDAAFLEKNIRDQFKGKLVFNSKSHEFSRAFAFNHAVAQCGNEIVFLCDADFSIPENIVQKCSSYTFKDSFWFPIVFYLYKNKPAKFSTKNGEWMIWGGKGLLACKKKSFVELGGLNEDFKVWGGEDDEFWRRCHLSGKIIIRSRERQLLHHWHPSNNPKYKKLEELSDLGLL